MSQDIRQLRARDIMQTKVVTVLETLTVRELAKLLMKLRITGAPVTNTDGSVVGIVSETDIVGIDAIALDDLKDEVHPYFRISKEAFGGNTYLINLEDLKLPPEKTISEIMTPWVVAASPETLIVDVAKSLSEKGIHRILVLDEDKRLLGIITSMDIVRAVSRCG